MLKNFFLEFKKLIYDIKIIFKNKKKSFIWFLILPLNIFITIVNIIIGIFYYIFLIVKLIFKLTQKKLKYKNIKPIQINKKKIRFNNYILQTLQLITTDLSCKTAFLFLYNQIDLIKKFNKKEGIWELIKKTLNVFIVIILKKLFFYVINIPYFVIKNNNELTFLINDILSMNAISYKAYISTICLNIIKDFNLIKNIKTKKLKIKFNKKKIYLNPSKNILEITEQIKSKEKLIKGSNLLLKNGKISMMSYLIQNKTVNVPHPSLYLETVDVLDKNKPAYLVINQSTKKYLQVGKDVEEDFTKKIENYKIKNELVVKSIIKDKITAYNVTPHLVHKNITQLMVSEKLINSWYKTENWIKQFNFIQSFFINMENKMYKVNDKEGLLEDNNYKNVKNFLEINYYNFTKDVQIGLENIIKFYDSNKELFLNNNNKLNFLKCLELAEINTEVKNFFWNILNKKI